MYLLHSRAVSAQSHHRSRGGRARAGLQASHRTRRRRAAASRGRRPGAGHSIPGVVELVGCREVDGVTTLYTGFVGAHTLETAPPLTVDQAGVTMREAGVDGRRPAPARASSTAGSTRRTSCSGPAGRPVLCGFTGARRRRRGPSRGARAPIAEFRDPAADAGCAAVADDRRVCARHAAPGARRRRRRRRSSRSPNVASCSSAAGLGTATCAAPFSRSPTTARTRSRCGGPSAGRLAADIEAVAATPGRRRRRRPPAIPTRSLLDRRPPAARWLTARGGGGRARARLLGRTRATREQRPTAATPSTPISSAARICRVDDCADGRSVDLADDSTRRDVTLVGDRVVSVDGHQFSVGDPGDRVVLGDWDCDGTPTAALARPSTGEVFVFDRWPVAGVEATVEPVGTVTGAVDSATEDTR